MIVSFYTQLRVRTCVIIKNIVYFYQEVKQVENYRKLYSILCSAASEAIDATPEKARQILQRALYEAEDLYLDADDA